MKTRTILLSAFLAGSTVCATAGTTGNYGASGTTSQDEVKTSTAPTSERESAYDSAIKPDRTMRHNTRQGRASTETNQYDIDRANQDWESRDRLIDQAPATRE